LPYPRVRRRFVIGATAFALSACAAGPALAATGGASAAGYTSDGHHYPGDSRHLGDRILRAGMSGHDVRVLQDYLTRAGFSTPITGYFGSVTLQHVLNFQSRHHLRPTGVVTYKVEISLRMVAAGVQHSLQSSGPVGHAYVHNGLAVAPSNAPAAVKAVIAAGNRIAFKPYIYGGGHGSWNAAGYDCSGSVSYALHGGGLISSPEDSGSLESYGSSGGGRWITIWTNSGHAYMYVAGLRFDTSAQGSTGGSRWTSAGRSSAGFVERHPSGF
jgi:peptidoglycan hydrolase-like protein with peptidoglycan-binding domain